MTVSVREELARRLEEAFEPLRLEIEDQSEQHRGHAGWDPRGETHFMVRLVSRRFEGMTRIARERAVQRALDRLLAGRIHALRLSLLTPEEAKARGLL